MSTQVRTFNRYSQAFKQKVIEEIESGGVSISKAMEIYDIRGCGTIPSWIKRFGKNHLLNKVVRIEMKDEADKIKQLKKEKTKLESALAKAHLKILSLESIIESAEEDLGIELKKSTEKEDSRNALRKEDKQEKATR